MTDVLTVINQFRPHRLPLTIFICHSDPRRVTAIFYLVDQIWDGRPEADGGNLVWWHVDEPGATAADESCKRQIAPAVRLPPYVLLAPSVCHHCAWPLQVPSVASESRPALASGSTPVWRKSTWLRYHLPSCLGPPCYYYRVSTAPLTLTPLLLFRRRAASSYSTRAP